MQKFPHGCMLDLHRAHLGGIREGENGEAKKEVSEYASTAMAQVKGWEAPLTLICYAYIDATLPHHSCLVAPKTCTQVQLTPCSYH